MLRHSMLLIGPRQLAWVEEELPPPGPGEILVRTRTGAVSVGTELPLYAGTHRGAQPITYPKMMGYESLGEIIACGDQVRLKRGERILAFYGHRTHALIPAHQAIQVPDDIPDSLALLAILGCDTARGVRKVKPNGDQRALITGAGTIGLLTLFNLKARQVAQVDVIEPLANRRQLALQFGAATAVPPSATAHSKGEYAIGFECSSRNAAFAELQYCLTRNGVICILADGNLEPFVLTPAFHSKELQVVGSSDGDEYPQYTAWFFDRIRQEHPPLKQLYEYVTHFNDLPMVFEQLVRGDQMPIKVLVHYNDNEAT